MNRNEKQQFVDTLSQTVEKAQAMAVMSFSKVTVEKMTSFRLDLGKKNISVKVVKNTLARRIFENTPYKDALFTHFIGPTLIAYSDKDPVITAKAIWDWANKEDFGVKFKVATALGQIISEKEFKALSQLPGREQLLVSFLYALKHHPTRFLYALQDPLKRMGYALTALKEKKG